MKNKKPTRYCDDSVPWWLYLVLGVMGIAIIVFTIFAAVEMTEQQRLQVIMGNNNLID